MKKYSLIIYLDKKSNNKIKLIQKKLFNLTGSKSCLKLWNPHITIGAGVKIKNKEEKQFHRDIENAIKNIKPFKIKIKDYGFMDNWMGGKLKGFTSYVIYINVIKNKRLQNLFNKIKEKVTDKRNLFYGPILLYNPHLTIAFKDLNKGPFLKAKKMLKKEKFEGQILINHIAIAKENKKGQWQEYKRFDLNLKN